jgi:Ca2+-binding EF-hand superfamily protein
VPNKKVGYDSLLLKLKRDVRESRPEDLEAFLTKAKDIADPKMVSWEKLKHILTEKSRKHMNARTAELDDQVKHVFDSVDFDDNGYISKEELTVALRHLGLNKTEKEVDNLYESFLHSNNRTLGIDEFKLLIEFEYSQEIVKPKIIAQRLRKEIERVDGFRKHELTEEQLKQLYKHIGRECSAEEFIALTRFLGAQDKRLETEQFINLAVNGPSSFGHQETHLATALIKVRSALSLNLLEVFQAFDHMPDNYVASFSENLFKSQLFLPNSCVKPTLGDSKFYYSNMYPPIGNYHLNCRNKVSASNKVHPLFKDLRPKRHISD